jgi:hypothetical protein
LPLAKLETFDRSVGSPAIILNGKPDLEVTDHGVRARNKAYYFYRVRWDYYVTEFCIVGAVGPCAVWTEVDGQPQEDLQAWEAYEEGEIKVFRAPDGYTDYQMLRVACDKRLNELLPMPPQEMDRLALRLRKSLVVNGMRDAPQ